MNNLYTALSSSYNLIHFIPSFVKVKGLTCEVQTTTVTVYQYNSLMGLPIDLEDVNMLKPKVNISYHECIQYIDKLNKQKGEYVYRLFDKGEFEIACTTQFDKMTDKQKLVYINCYENSKSLQQVGLKLPNVNGLYDILGNCWIWTNEQEDTSRVIRSGSWGYFARYLRSAGRSSDYPDSRGDRVGFRLVRTRK